MEDEKTALRSEEKREDGQDEKGKNADGEENNHSASEVKPLKRVNISSGQDGEKQALCGHDSADKMGAGSRSRLQHSSAGSFGKKKHSSDPTFVRRVGSTPTTDKAFERPPSQLGSRKSLASVKTRTASVSRSEYHADLKSGLKAVSMIY